VFELCLANLAKGFLIVSLIVDLHAGQFASVQEEYKQIAQRD
jgi:hypothetical protein